MKAISQQKPGLIYRLICAGDGFLFGLIMTMLPIYKIRVLDLSPFQLVILGTVMELCIFFCEVPTGIVADLKSRKLSTAIGYTGSGIAFLIAGLAMNFSMLVISAVIWGVAETFISGAREAWVADELEAHQDSETAESAFVAGKQWLLVARFVGTWVSVFFALWSLNTPIIIGSALMCMMGFFVFFISEKGFKPLKDVDHSIGSMVKTFKKGWLFTLASAALVTAIFTNFLIGFSSEGFDRLWQKLIEDEFKLPSFTIAGVPEFDVFWFAVLNSGAMLLSVVVLGYLTRARHLSSLKAIRQTMLFLVICIMIGLVAYGYAPNLWIAIAAFLFVRTIRRCTDPILTSWVNMNASPEIRATLLSFSGQVHSFGEILSGPTIGVAAQQISVRVSMYLSAGLLLPGIPVLIRRMVTANKADKLEQDS